MKINIDIDPEVIPQIIKTLEEKRENLLKEAAKIEIQIMELKNINMHPSFELATVKTVAPVNTEGALVKRKKYETIEKFREGRIEDALNLFNKKKKWLATDIEKEIVKFLPKDVYDPKIIRKEKQNLRGILITLRNEGVLLEGEDISKPGRGRHAHRGRVYYEKA